MVVRQKVIQEKHQFAFFYQDIELLFKSDGVLFDAELLHRVSRVVKLAVGEEFILFNQQLHVVVELLKVEKRSLQVKMLSQHKNKDLQPHITFMLPLLKREALEESVYSLAEMGINKIQLIITQKSRQKLTDKDMLRLRKVIIAAAEQSKHFAFPQLSVAQDLKNYVFDVSKESVKVVFDMLGQKFLQNYKNISNQQIYLTVGPEGSFTQEELQFLKEHGFNAYALTQTVLRSIQAVAIGAALFRL